jgi:hypothetical protein
MYCKHGVQCLLVHVEASGNTLCTFTDSATQCVLPELQATHVRMSIVVLACINNSHSMVKLSE